MGTLSAQDPGRKMGKSARQIIVKGACAVCGQKMNLFTSDAKMGDQFPGLVPSPTGQEPTITGGESPSVITDLWR